ncbi:copper resistance protein CopC [Nocardioides panzhihuensis]|uniref:Copper transport protein n=1 Tax=Nocardioides panzhihuensis TaxID=860243 RepID=A0A7Z0DK36_9ACTN|nr:copper transport protein [Nocardioides panzhihuensis]
MKLVVRTTAAPARRMSLQRGWRIALATLLGVLTLAYAAPAAQAHATLLFATPSVEGAVPTSPNQVRLVFDQEVIPAESALELEGPRGAAIRVGPTTSGENGRTVSAAVLEELDVGQYVVDWTVTAKDGDTMTGKFRFAVGSRSGLTLGGGDEPEVRGLTALTMLRIGLFSGLALTLGGLVGARITRRSASSQTRKEDPEPWLLAGSLLGLVSAAGLAVVLLGSGSLAGGIARLRPLELLNTTPGLVAAVELIAFAAAAAACLARRGALAAATLVAVAAAEGVRAHPQATIPGWGAALTFLHLCAAAVWIGALIHVVRVGLSRRRRGLSAVEAMRGYARVAVWLFLLVLGSGVMSGLVLAVPGGLVDTLTETKYGRWLIVKLAVVMVVAALAVWARRHLAARPNAVQPSRAARIEVAGLGGVLAISALLTSLAPPVQADLELPFPPPPVGPVSAAGGRAGWIGIGLTASQGQLLVRLSTPDMHPAEDPVDATTYELVANALAPEDTSPRALRLRRCGTGCFVAPMQWQRGRTTITLKATSSDFRGGTTALTVAWPAKQATQLLKQTVRVMQQVPALVLYEQVTSDTNGASGIETRIPMSGQELVDSDPYGSGIAPTVVLLGHDPDTGETELALAYPGEGTYVHLTLDHHDRIVRETLNAPKHRTTRTLVYPEDDDGHDHEH